MTICLNLANRISALLRICLYIGRKQYKCFVYFEYFLQDLGVVGANCTADPTVCKKDEPLLTGDGK